MTAAVSSVTRSAGRVNVIGYGSMPGPVISYCPYCVTTVPPRLANSVTHVAFAASAGLGEPNA